MSGGDFSSEINLFYKRIFKLCLFYLKDVQDAEDAAQLAVEKIWANRHRFSGQSAVSTWMFRIAVNTAINALRRRALLRWVSLTADAGSEPLAGWGLPAATPAQELERAQEQELSLAALERGLAGLSAREKTAFYLFHYERMRQRDIAEIMKTSVPAVESLIHKAMKKVRRSMAGK